MNAVHLVSLGCRHGPLERCADASFRSGLPSARCRAGQLLQAGSTSPPGAAPTGVLREATRLVGVAPNAAYRHFADREALVSAVAAVALRRLAQTMLERIDALPTMAPPQRAGAALGEVGRAYVDFAVAEPGLFHTAFAPRTRPALDGPGPQRSSPTRSTSAFVLA